MDGNIKTGGDTGYESKSQGYKMLNTMFATDHREWRDNLNHWKANKSCMFVILLQYFPKDLTQRLKLNGKYEAMNDSKEVIALIKMIHYVARQHDDTTQGNMALVTSDLDLYTKFMTNEDDTEEFYGKLNAMADRINVHGGSSGYHTQLYADHLTLFFVNRDLDQTTISKDELEKVKKYAKS